MYGYYYVYINKKGSTIIKLLSYDNNLSVGNYNSYEHKLIYKVKLVNGKVCQIKKHKNKKIDFSESSSIKRKMIKI